MKRLKLKNLKKKNNNNLDEIILSLLNDTGISVNSLIRQIVNNYNYKQTEITNTILNLELDGKVAYTGLGDIYKIKN